MIYLFATLFVREAWLIICSHDSLASPLADLAAQICFPTLAHLTISAEGLRWESLSKGIQSEPCLMQNTLVAAFVSLSQQYWS